MMIRIRVAGLIELVMAFAGALAMRNIGNPAPSLPTEPKGTFLTPLMIGPGCRSDKPKGPGTPHDQG